MGMTYSFAPCTVVLFVNTSSEEMMASSSSGKKTGTFFVTKVSRNHARIEAILFFCKSLFFT
jgi:hypothetical protein